MPAFLEHTREVMFLEEGDIAEITAAGAKITDVEGNPIARPSKTITWDAAQAEKGGYKHFMLKEIHEQPRAIADTLRGRLASRPATPTWKASRSTRRTLRRVVLLACGTSYHAGLVGKFLIEGDVAHPVRGRSRQRVPLPRSGRRPRRSGRRGLPERRDRRHAGRGEEARQRGAQVLAICNVVDSAIPRASQGALYTHAGPEIGVASTKCFTAQLAALVLLAIYLGRRTGTLAAEAAKWLVQELSGVPTKMSEALESLGDMAELAAAVQGRASDFLFLGRGTNYPIALEGALKLKEISYIHAEGYAAGEMKHGPIALVDDGVPVVVLAPRGPGYEKVLSNLAEVRARNGHIIAIATKGDKQIGSLCDRVLTVPDAPPILQPFLTVLPLQLMGYAIALAKGNDVDQPRNLAKSVTVE